MNEIKSRISLTGIELARISLQRRRARQHTEWKEFDVTVQANSPVGFSDSDVNKRLALSFVKVRAAEMLSKMDVRHVKPEELCLYQPLITIEGTGFSLPREVKSWVTQKIRFTEELPHPELSWIALRTSGRRGQERVAIVEAVEPELDDWTRYRRFSRANQQGYHTALPFLLHEEAVMRRGSKEPLERLARALLRGS